ncbi:MAG TPA: alcohol dehydrogenase [Deltaproteobacteria bacterium]|nr:MAG: alcohol dehydrogenase [Deltaproteobacteria bacterium GWA2_55_82]OGQ64150.1 MAG: alcohol dehydrogenase [Deltaproteobacteria bacterium RIFCSPLOWO2_02_FULL_55_12]OIJ74602.1 MAG: alcohol dehydrogenase [Deltaproteobacteria bacterium GWC2_55_46]HBG46455.1 alcohol dehydrogenase [Deltaproteobacteria bacterium]HCY10667.1 alcohol dehydrogenase [Deltaproteobacteria bacterium]
MKAIVFDGGLRLEKGYPRPVPGPGEALVKVALAGVCSTDLEIAKGYMGFKGVPGHEFTGTIVECDDERLNGKRVAGEINLGCGRCEYCRHMLENHCPSRKVLGISGKDGAFAEYLTLPFKNIHPLPDSITDEEAVFTEPLAAAYEILEQVRVDENTRACVLGDGRLGLLVAEVMAATECSLVVIGRHEEKLQLLKAREIPARTSPEGLEKQFDLVIDCTGSEDGLTAALDLVRPTGTVILKTTLAKRGGADLNRVVIDEITLLGSRCGPFPPALAALEEKRVDVRPLISRVFSLDEGVEAIGHASGKGVLKVLIRME